MKGERQWHNLNNYSFNLLLKWVIIIVYVYVRSTFQFKTTLRLFLIYISILILIFTLVSHFDITVIFAVIYLYFCMKYIW